MGSTDSDPDASAAYRKAVQLLARRPHFTSEIRRKLTQRGFEQRDCEATLRRLARESLIDDLATAIGFVESRLRRGPIGQRRMRAELGRRGAEPGTVDEAIRRAMPSSEEDLARDAARRWLRKGGQDRDALLRYLDRLGFRPRDIVSAASELADVDRSAG